MIGLQTAGPQRDSCADLDAPGPRIGSLESLHIASTRTYRLILDFVNPAHRKAIFSVDPLFNCS